MNDETLTAADGTRLMRRRWSPTGEPRSTIVLLHGIAEHGGRYDHVGTMLAARGHEVTATDFRGFGRSDGRRAFVTSSDVYLDDVALDISEARGSGRPVVLLGHSMGGLLALDYALSARPAPDLLVLSAPAIADDLPKVKKTLVKALAAVAPKLSVDNGLDGSLLSRDPSVGERYFEDPLVYTRTTTSLGRALLRSQDRSQSTFRQLELPTLVIHGGADRIIPPSASAPLGELPNVDRILFPPFRHESFNEEGGTEAVTTVADWLDRKLGDQ